MGKKWDYDVPAVEVWQECLRVLKPGGHLLAFAGTRTQHRMAVRIEDAGFEIRDMIAWVYGSGFPKSLDVSKAIDKAAGAERKVIGSKVSRQPTGNAYAQDEWTKQHAVPQEIDITAPATEAAKQWQGWGTALKPSLEPITVARKPLRGTVAENVLQYGTGGINVDGCRVGTEDTRAPAYKMTSKGKEGGGFGNGMDYSRIDSMAGSACGRWPANLIHDGSDEVVGLFPEEEEQSASRFFYCAKAGPDERRDSKHPTVKPVALMRYLVRLVTPIGATVLDPFCGSGTTLEAAMLESCKAIGIEMNPEYCGDAVERLRQGVLF